MQNALFDVAIIGGGINGCGCAADASLRGLSVALYEQDDIASKTSSSSTKLIHGGLRYLEQFQFSLVRKALTERAVLLAIAPHLVHPIQFVLPTRHQSRPNWMVRLGLFIYDNLSQHNHLPHSQYLTRQTHESYFSPLATEITQGFSYYDGATDDARLTLSNALLAKQHGANIQLHTKLLDAKIQDNHWILTLAPKHGTTYQIRAKAIINATGPWVNEVDQRLHMTTSQPITLVKGSHIVVPKLYDGEQAYILQHDDQRVIFVIPYHGYSMVGTTDVVFQETLDQVVISESEMAYLLDIVNQYFQQSLQMNHVIHHWSGVRPLLASPGKSARKLSRDYTIHWHHTALPSLSIYGGKITTYRQLAQDTLDKLAAFFPTMSPAKTAFTPLPGAKFGTMSLSQYQQYLHQQYPWLPEATKNRYLRTYGTRTELILKDRQSLDDLGVCFATTVYAAEIDYLCQEEWARSLDDILWRRTKLGLHMQPNEKLALKEFLQNMYHMPTT